MDALSALSPAPLAPTPGKRPGALTAEQQAQVDKLRARDREVRAHEQAHLAAAGGLARGGATFTTTRGPDGKLYATGGEVSIDTSPVPNNPAATLAKARQIQAAAAAPADPSGQDRSVAAAAARMAAQASQDLARKRQGGPIGASLDLAG